MIFLDTCIWIELVAAKSPVTPQEIKQASLAGELIKKISEEHEVIVTCREQLLEIISAVQKYKMREYNRLCKDTSVSGVGNIKEFRETEKFKETQELCRQVCDDVRKMAENMELSGDSIDGVLDNLHLVDINDYLYYEYCVKAGADFYTFDGDFKNLPPDKRIHILM